MGALCRRQSASEFAKLIKAVCVGAKYDLGCRPGPNTETFDPYLDWSDNYDLHTEALFWAVRGWYYNSDRSTQGMKAGQ